MRVTVGVSGSGVLTVLRVLGFLGGFLGFLVLGVSKVWGLNRGYNKYLSYLVHVLLPVSYHLRLFAHGVSEA